MVKPTIKSTRQTSADAGVKILTYGGPKVGKTRLCATTGDLEHTLIISAEAGLLSLRQYDLHAIEVNSLTDVLNAYKFLQTSEGQQYRWVCLDSISEISELVLNAEKKNTTDPRKAYGAMGDQMMELIRAFRDLSGRNVYLSAKMSREKDELSGAMLYAPMMPGKQLGTQIPYLFDEIFVLRAERDVNGGFQSALQTFTDHQYVAGDRSGALSAYEPPNLAAIAAKINGTHPTQPNQE